MNGMNIEATEKKLREASFFLKKMIDHERKAFNDKEPFDFYLSAFLNAGRTVDYRLRHEQAEVYPNWRIGWDATLTEAEQRLIRFMVDDRNVEVHESGSSRRVGIEKREFGSGTHTLADGTMDVTGAPGYARVTMQVPGYYFTIDGIERKATEACAEYLRLLEKMVAKFKSDHP
jgi:hypothetical protein